MVLMQDGAPCYTWNVVQSWFWVHLNFWPKDIWPPSSPDLNPLDYLIWANVQGKVNVKQYTNTKAIKAAINKVWADMSRDKIKNICTRFRPRVKAIIKAKGRYIDYREDTS